MQQPAQDLVALRWQPNRVGLVLSAAFLPLLLWLGCWQLERADYKAQIVALNAANQQAPAVDLAALASVADAQYRAVRVTGRYQPAPQFVVDNRVRNGRPGYEIVQLFSPADGSAKLLVNRGWIGADLDRATLPQVPAPAGQVTLSGTLYQRLPGGLQLDDRVAQPLAGQQRVGWIDRSRVAEWLNEPLYAYQLRLDRASPGALETGWPVVAVYPQKHTGYAVQWFIMAGVLALLTLLANSNLSAWWRARRGR